MFKVNTWIVALVHSVTRTRLWTGGLASLVLFCGCDVKLTPSDVTATLTTPTSTDVTPGFVKVVFSNETDAALDVNFFVSQTKLTQIQEELFVEGNLTTAGIGLGSNGRLGPSTSDSIEIACTDEMALGTNDSGFIDPETGDSLGLGVQRWVVLGAQFDCGDTVFIEFRRNGQDYETALALGF